MVDKSLGMPLYEQVANELRQEILGNRYGEHGSIGTHTELANRFGVSMITIRRAVQILQEEGMVNIQQGRGTFVCRTSLVDHLHNLTATSLVMNTLQVKINVWVPLFEVCKTPSWMEESLRSAMGARCVHIQRVVSLQDSGLPFSYVEMYLPERFINRIFKADVEQSTVYQILQKRLGIVLGKGRQIMRASGATGETAQYLRLPENWPVMRIERKAYDNQGSLIEYMISSYESSKYSYEVELDLQAD